MRAPRRMIERIAGGMVVITVSLGLAGSAVASTWTLSGSGSSTVGGFDFADLNVALGDPSGSATASTAGGIPMTIGRSATMFSLSGSFNQFDAECLATGSFSGTRPIVTTGGLSTATGASSLVNINALRPRSPAAWPPSL